MATTIANSLKPRPLNPFKPHLTESLPLSPSQKPLFLKASTINTRIKSSKLTSLVPAIRAQSSSDYSTDVKFYKVEAITRQWRVPSGLLKMGIRGMAISDIRGFGAQGGSTERHCGSEFSEDKFITKVKTEIVVAKDQVDAVIDKIIEVARTGEIGDGKIFVIHVSDVIRIRTGEHCEKDERMTGGRADMISSTSSN